ncbi:hypothetical protein FRC03_004144 [Tulasnella sp. 419]|nr:hypothetical protein FRC03_004144 [Tulasnella sp. 419]
MKVAVIGSGVSGLSATWLLNEHSPHKVHLFEADDRPGGHANTVQFIQPGKPDAKPVNVDRGFIVFNIPTYPNFARFLHICDIAWKKTQMTFSVSRDRGRYEWAGKNLFTVFCQMGNLFDPQFYRMIWDVLRFNATTTAIISRGDAEKEFGSLSLGEYLRKEEYSDAFMDNYMLPMTAAIWNTPPDLCALNFPARSQIRFLYNHHLLQFINKPPWLTVDGGSQVYVNRIVSKLPAAQIHLSTPIQSVTSYQAPESASGYRLVLKTADGKTEEFDHIVLATHSDVSLKLLQNGSDTFHTNSGALPVSKLEKRVLSGFGWAKNEVVLHNDTDLMPKRRIAWSCWNFLTKSSVDAKGRIKPNADQVTLTCTLLITYKLRTFELTFWD